jgi:hypothetical protein
VTCTFRRIDNLRNIDVSVSEASAVAILEKWTVLHVIKPQLIPFSELFLAVGDLSLAINHIEEAL